MINSKNETQNPQLITTQETENRKKEPSTISQEFYKMWEQLKPSIAISIVTLWGTAEEPSYFRQDLSQGTLIGITDACFDLVSGCLSPFLNAVGPVSLFLIHSTIITTKPPIKWIKKNINPFLTIPILILPTYFAARKYLPMALQHLRRG